jgi:ADP-heptose:LPS heptosyltransferase
LAIDSQGTVKSAAACYLSKANRRLGPAVAWRREALAGPAYTETYVPEGVHVIDLNLSILETIGLAAMPGLVPDGRFLVGSSVVPRAQRLLVGAGQDEKVLPIETMIEVARRLSEQGPVEVLWGPGERDIAFRVAEAAKVELAPRTDIPALAERLASATVVIGVDTGPIHLAASLGVPVVALFLCTDPVRNGPRGERVRVLSAVESLASPSPGSSAARRVRDLDADEIVAAVAEVVAGCDFFTGLLKP